jgi:hypothetical protein
MHKRSYHNNLRGFLLDLVIIYAILIVLFYVVFRWNRRMESGEGCKQIPGISPRFFVVPAVDLFLNLTCDSYIFFRWLWSISDALLFSLVSADGQLLVATIMNAIVDMSNIAYDVAIVATNYITVLFFCLIFIFLGSLRNRNGKNLQ